jgi:hypothetical protein
LSQEDDVGIREILEVEGAWLGHVESRRARAATSRRNDGR